MGSMCYFFEIIRVKYGLFLIFSYILRERANLFAGSLKI